MQRFLRFCTFVLCSFSLLSVTAQLNPTISGDNMLCPNSTGTLTTQQFDTYQWYVRYYGSPTTDLISGATSQSLVIDYSNYAATHLSVVVTSGAETDTSAEFFVDGWVFAGMTVMSQGDFTVGPQGESVICSGDTMYFEVLSPYSANIQWYQNGQPIAGANGISLTVTEAGTYNVEGAPGVCPDNLSNPGVDLVVLVENCSGAGIADPTIEPAQVFPVPAVSVLHVSHDTELIRELAVTNQLGQRFYHATPHSFNTTISTEAFESGYYFLTIRYGESIETRSFTVE